MIRINLIPARSSRKKEKAILQGAVAVVALIIAFVVSFFIEQNVQRRIDAEKAEISSLNKQIDELQAVIKQVESFKKKKKDLEVKIQTIKDLNQKRSGPVRLLEEVGSILPTKVWITNFREQDKQLSLEGMATDGTAISDLVDNMKRSAFFRNVTLQLINQSDDKGKRMQRFTITCGVNYLVKGA